MSGKILYISGNGFPTSDADARGTFSLEHAEALMAEGMSVQAVDTQSDGFASDMQKGVPIDRLPRLRVLLKRFDIKGVTRYLRYFTDLRRNGNHQYVFFAFFYLKYIPLILILKRTGVPVMVQAMGGEVMHRGRVHQWLKRRMFNMVDVATPISDFTSVLLSSLIRRKDRDNHKIVTIPCGVNWEKLTPTTERAEFREQIGVPQSDFVILSICSLVKRKGIDILVRAIGAQLAEGKEVSHVIIGRGPEKDALARLAEDSGSPEKFVFVDRVTTAEMANFYAMADLFAMISITSWDDAQTEGFGITYAEAMALGIPVIGGAGSGTTTPIKDGFNGVLIDPHARQPHLQVQAAIEKFMTDPDFYKRTSENARWYSREFFDWQTNAKQTIAAFEDSLKGQR